MPSEPEGAPDRVRRRPLASPAVGLAVAVVCSGVLLLALGARLTFLLDDWEFLLYRPGWTLHQIMTPHGEHISVLPIVVYKGLQETVGMDSALPYRVVSTALFLLSAVLLFVWMRRRVDDWLALIAVTVVLSLGAAWEDLLWSFQIGFFGSMAAGLAMLLALEREDRAGDLAACALLTVSISFGSLGLPFVAGALVEVIERRGEWLRRLYVVAIPVILYGLWWLGWGHQAQNVVSFHNFLHSPKFVYDSMSAAWASLLGLPTPWVRAHDGDHDYGRLIGAIALAAGLWHLWRNRRAERWLWVVIAIGGGFWFFDALNADAARPPDASRYQYISAIFVLMIAASLLRGVRIGRWVIAAFAVVAALSVASNVDFLVESYYSYRRTSNIERADLGAMQVARKGIDSGFVLEEDIADTAYVHVDATNYFTNADKYGSPAYSPAEIGTAPEYARVPADKVIWAAETLHLKAIGRGSLAGADCRTLEPSTTSPAVLRLPAAGVSLRSLSRQPTQVTARRFARDSFPVVLRPLRPGESAELALRPDGATRPWQLQLTGNGPVKVCGLPG